MVKLIVKDKQVKCSQNGRVTYIYDVEDTSIESLIKGLNKETDENLEDRLYVDDIIIK